MKKILSVIGGMSLLFGLGAQPLAEKPIPTADAQNAMEKTDRLYFIENKGQWHSDVLYLCRMGGLDAWITKYGVNYTFYKIEKNPTASTNREAHFPKGKFDHEELENSILLGHRVLFELQNANPNPATESRKKQQGYYNYFIGNDPSKHASNVGLYKEVVIKDVYPGIDIRYYFDRGFLRYDFVVQPGADPSQIAFKLKGQYKDYVKEGALCYTTRFGEVQMAELKSIQDGKAIVSNFIKNGDIWNIQLSNYYKTKMLIIDPLVYSTYIGGGGDDIGSSIAIDASGNAYITGWTNSSDYDVTPGAFQVSYGGGFLNVFVTKINSTGNTLMYSTYIGGSVFDYGYSIAVDASSNAYITGYTQSPDYDITVVAFQSSYGGGGDVFVTKLNAAGNSLIYSTYIGGSGEDWGNSIAIDASGNAYITGYTGSPDYDVTVGTFQTTHGGGYRDVFVTKINATGNALIYSTYIGGSSDDAGNSIAIDASGNAYITGYTGSPDYDVTAGAFQTTCGGNGFNDVFVTKLNPTGTGLVYSTYIGKSSSEVGQSIAIDPSGYAYITGFTQSPDFDITPGAFQTSFGGGTDDVFVTKLNFTGTGLIYSTFIGGSSSEYGNSITIDASGNAYITGNTYSTDYDVTAGAFQTSFGGGTDVFFTQINSNGTSLLYSTFIGYNGAQEGKDIEVDGSGSVYITGYTSANFPVTSGAYQTFSGGGNDVFVTKLCLMDAQLNSLPGTDNQTVCINTPIINIDYVTINTTGIGTTTGLPPGLSVVYSGSTITVSGTPSVSGTYIYNIPLIGPCNLSITGTVNVLPDNTYYLISTSGSDNQTVCVNSPINNIAYLTNMATGIGTPTGLPTGVNALSSNSFVVISGTPTATGVYNYTIPLTGGCGNVSIFGTINVSPPYSFSLTSMIGTDNQTVCANTPITNITYTTTGTGIGVATGLPPGVIVNYSGGTITVSGIPNTPGVYSYSIPLTGGCGNTNITGNIVVNPNNTITLVSASGTDNQSVCINSGITSIVYNAPGTNGIGTPAGLPPGVNVNYSGGVVVISGTPGISGTFTYSVPLTGGCNNTGITGTITVNPNSTFTLVSSSGTDNQSVCENVGITSIVYNTTGSSGIGTPIGLPSGVSANYTGGIIIISGTPTTQGTYNYNVPLTGGCGNTTITGTINVQSCTGINEINQNTLFAIYPNPNNGQFTIESEKGGVFELVDITGKVLNIYEVKESKITIQENLPAGFYFIREKNTGIVSKLVVE